MTQKEIKKILKLHEKWLKGEYGGRRANFSNENLTNADLSGADLRLANLRYADLSGAKFSRANFDAANLEGANFSNANLIRACLSNTNLNYANLYSANLTCANLDCADLISASLAGATLISAILTDADLRGANLAGANLYGTRLNGANLDGAILDDEDKFRKGTIVKSSITGWKKCRNGVLVKLRIPRGAVVFCINGRQCRTNVAKVVEVIGAEQGVSAYDREFVFRVGKTYKIDDFCLIYNVECAEGIHFFRTREEAEQWEML